MKSAKRQKLIVKVKKTIYEHGMITSGDTVIAGVSGGKDSMCMLEILSFLKDDLNFKIKVCHFNHCLRGAESDEDEVFVKDYCFLNNLSFFSKKQDVKAYAKKNSKSLEEAARILRYSFLNEYAKEKNSKIAIAHHMNDQAETVMLNLIRGAGTAGIAGMRYVSDNVIRPLLDCSLEEIDQFIDLNDIKYRTDITNFLPDCDRNKMRLKVIPVLKENFNRNIVESITKTSLLCRADDEYLNSLAEVFYKEHRKENGISCKLLQLQDLSFSSRVVRLEYEKAKGDRMNLSFKHTHIILDYILKNPRDGSLDLPDNMVAVIKNGHFFICTKEEFKKNNSIAFTKDLSIEHEVVIPCEEVYPNLSIKVLIKPLQKSPNTIVKKSKLGYNTKIYVLPKEIVNGAVWRFIRPHDRIRPNAKSGSKPVRKYLNEMKISPARRNLLVVMAKGSDVIVVLGLPLPYFKPLSQKSDDVEIHWNYC